MLKVLAAIISIASALNIDMNDADSNSLPGDTNVLSQLDQNCNKNHLCLDDRMKYSEECCNVEPDTNNERSECFEVLETLKTLLTTKTKTVLTEKKEVREVLTTQSDFEDSIFQAWQEQSETSETNWKDEFLNWLLNDRPEDFEGP